MIDTVGSFGEELESLEIRYAMDSEGLSQMEYFEKYASPEYKAWTVKKIKEIEENRKNGIR